jgi:hypothetical protein
MPDLNIIQRENVNLVLEGGVIENFTESVSGEVFWRYKDEPDSEPVFLGEAVAGRELVVPFDFKDGRGIELFLISKTAFKSFSATRAVHGTKTTFNPNTETAIPFIYQSGISGNALLKVAVERYTDNAKFRKIHVASTNTFTDFFESIQNTINEPGATLNPIIEIPRNTNLTEPETKYVRVAHSSNGEVYGEWSNIIMVTFADDGGSGGTSPGTGYGGSYKFPIEPAPTV